MGVQQRKVLGLDLGTSSIGWALLTVEGEAKDERLVSIDDGDVIVFPPSKPTAADRRVARGMRRQLSRRKGRRGSLRQRLVAHGLLPRDALSPRIDGQEREFDRLIASNPYELRYRAALGERLDPFEIGRALYHLGQRRGFKSNRILDRSSGDEKEHSAFKEALRGLKDEIDACGSPTLGAHIWRAVYADPSERIDSKFFGEDTKRRGHIRGVHTHRDSIRAEFDYIWARQRGHWPDLLTGAAKAEIAFGSPKQPGLFYQRPLRSQAHLRGRCQLESEERRAHKGSWWFQRFALLQTLTNLRVETEVGEPERLTPEQIRKLATQLSQKKTKEPTMTVNAVKKAVGIDTKLNFTAERFDREGKALGLKEIQGNATEFVLRKAFGVSELYDFDSLDPDVRDRIVDLLLDRQFDEKRLSKALRRLLPEGEPELISTLATKTHLPTGFGSHSEKALRKLLDWMEQGYDYAQARELAGYVYESKAAKGQLPLVEECFPDLRNPAVVTVLCELRKTVNAVVDKHGMPDTIRVELARDLKNSKAQRSDIEKEQRRRQKFNAEIEQRLIEDLGVANPRPQEKLRYKLWLENDKRCLYTGQCICQEQLLTDACEVDHIVPFSVSLDDGYNNKTLCFTEANRLKSNRLPSQAFPQDFAAIKQRARKLPSAKRNKVLLLEVPEQLKPQTRLLNDTRWASKLAREYLSHLIDSNNVQVGSGQATALIRGQLGLNSLLGDSYSKNRENHFHHMLDAIVIALTSPSLLRRFSEASQREGRERPRMPDDIRELARSQAEELLGKAKISYRQRRRVRGQLHEATVYSKVKHPRPGRERRDLRTRKKAEELSFDEFQAIADDAIRDAVEKFIVDLTGDEPLTGTNFKNRLEAAFKSGTQPKMSSGVPIKRVRIHVAASGVAEIRKGQYVRTGSNHELLIYEGPDGGWRYQGVTLLDASRRKQDSAESAETRRKEFRPRMVLRKQDLIELRAPLTVSNGIAHQGIYYVQSISVTPNETTGLRTEGLDLELRRYETRPPIRGKSESKKEFSERTRAEKSRNVIRIRASLNRLREAHPRKVFVHQNGSCFEIA